MDMRAIVVDRVKQLQQLDVAAIQLLPPLTKEALAPDGKIRVTQYHDVSDAGEHKVVVQAMRHRWFGLSTAIGVDGFVLNPDGTKRPLAEKEKWPFM